MPAPAHPPGLDLNSLIDRLAECDSQSSVVAPDDSTIANLKVQLDTLSEELACPKPTDPFADESACRRAIEIVAAIGKDPAFLTATAADRTNVADERDADVPASIGQYRILSRLAVGGMGAVYKALHTKLEKVVALKVLPADRLKDSGAVARFEREMRAVGKLHHPNIVAAHDAGEVNGTHYLVMELVEGIDLGTLLKQRGSLPVAESCEIIRQAALGLQHAHEHGLVHRDIKPSNLMLAEGQGSRVRSQGTELTSPLTLSPQPLTVKVLDLGLALLDSSHCELAGELTSTGQIMGTLDYMAPEQGSDTHSVDIRADIYSLGATLYKLLTGRAPFEGPQYNTPMKKLTALATVDPQPVRELRPDVPPDLAALVHRMLAKLPEHRPIPPTAVAEHLQPFSASANLARLLNGELGENGTKLPLAESATDPTVVGPTELVGDAAAGPSVPAVAPATATMPTEPPNRRGRRVRTLLKAAAVLVPLALITIQMKQGTVTIRTDENLADDVRVVVKSGGEEVAVMDKENNWTITVRAGEYQVETRGGNDEFTVVGDRIGVSRWGTTYVEIERLPEQVAAKTIDQQNATVPAAAASPNFALHFDGNHVVQIPSLQCAGAVPLTVEAWACPTPPPERGGAVVAAGGGSVGMYLQARTDGPTRFWMPYFRLELGTAEELLQWHGAPAIPEQEVHDRWVHLAVCYGEQGFRFYLNGKLHAQSSVGLAPIKETRGFLIGQAGGVPPDTCFFGIIDDVRVSNVVRYTEEFTPARRFNPDEHTLALYHFDEGEGDVLIDSSGSDHHGTILGATWVKQVGPEAWVPVREYDDDRQVAEWVLSHGGGVKVADSDQLITDREQLSMDDFRIWAIELKGTGVRDADLARLLKLRGLTGVSLNVTDIGDEGLAYLARIPTLNNVGLNSTRITNAGAKHLERLTALRTLYLGLTSVDDRALESIATLKNLETLDLTWTRVTDDGLRRIATLDKLSGLSLEETKVTAAGVAELRRALPGCRIDWTPRWTPTPEQQAFLDAVPLLPAEQQESAVREKLKAANPGYDGSFEHIITDGKVVRVSLKGNTQTVHEIWPIAALTGLTELLLGEAPVADLSSLTGLTELRFLSCYGTAITDNAPVSTLRKLEVFDCRETLVRDLSPLAGLPLKELRTFAVSPYNEQFRQLAATWPQLETINDIPIGEFLARRDEVEELRKKLPAFPAEKQLELAVEKLKEFNPGWDGGLTHQIVEGKLARILLAPPHVVWDVSPLAALPDLKDLTCNGNPQLADLSPLAGTRLEQLYCHASGIGDLSPLRGLRLKGLVCGDNPIDDLSPLAGMPLTMLLCDNSPVSELSPLAGCPLEQLSFSTTRVSDLSPLKEMPLKYVECGTTRVTSLEALRGKQLTFLGCSQNGISDLSPLAGMPLEELRCHYTQVRDFSPLAGMPLAKLHVSSNDGLSDLSVLAGMPLADLDCRFSAVSDYSPLSGMPLERIAIDFHLLGAHDEEEVLRSLPKVTEINSLPAAEFWPQVEQRRRAAAEWKDALTAVSGEQQFTTVRQQLIELHATFAYVPSFSLEPIYADSNLVELSIVVHSGDLTDLRPLCGLTHLRRLSLTGHLPHVRDLSPLYALPLEELHVDSDVVLRSNVLGLRTMPTLKTINGRPAAEYSRLLAEPDRVTAEVVFRLGGKVVVLVPDEPEPRTIESVEALPAMVRRLDAVDLSYTQVRDEDLVHLRHAAGLKTLSLDTAEHVSDAALVHLAGLPLRALDLRNTQVSDAGLPELLQLPYLAELSLQHTAVTDAGMAVLARLPRLERLVLSNNRISDAGVAQFRGMTSLRVLSIYDTQLTDAGPAHVATLVNLEDLSLSSTAVTDAGLKHLLPLQQLHHLFLERTAISDVGLAHLAALSNLRVLFLRETGIGDAGLTHLETAPVLQELFLERTRVTEEGIRQLHAARPLIRIHWDGGVIEPEAAGPAR